MKTAAAGENLKETPNMKAAAARWKFKGDLKHESSSSMVRI